MRYASIDDYLHWSRDAAARSDSTLWSTSAIKACTPPGPNEDRKIRKSGAFRANRTRRSVTSARLAKLLLIKLLARPARLELATSWFVGRLHRPARDGPRRFPLILRGCFEGGRQLLPTRNRGGVSHLCHTTAVCEDCTALHVKVEDHCHGSSARTRERRCVLRL
jgi:hypothetical protein